MAGRAFDERWVDAEPRPGKRGGAFCMPFFDDRSLVLMNWADGFDSVQTLAHELGHAYHNVQLAERTAAAAPAPDGAGRDGEHLLRDARGGGGARGRDRRRRAPGPARRRPPGSRPGGRRHPQPLPVRDRGVLPAAPPDLERRRAVRADARRPGRGLRRRARPRHPPPLDVGGEAPLLLQPLLQLALHLRAAVRPRALRPLPRRPRRVPHGLRRAALDHRHGRRRRARARASGSTCATPAFWAASLDVLRGRIADYEALVAERTA